MDKIEVIARAILLFVATDKGEVQTSPCFILPDLISIDSEQNLYLFFYKHTYPYLKNFKSFY